MYILKRGIREKGSIKKTVPFKDNRSVRSKGLLLGLPRNRAKRAVLIALLVADSTGIYFAESGVFHGGSAISRIGLVVSTILGVSLWNRVLGVKNDMRQFVLGLLAEAKVFRDFAATGLGISVLRAETLPFRQVVAGWTPFGEWRVEGGEWRVESGECLG